MHFSGGEVQIGPVNVVHHDGCPGRSAEESAEAAVLAEAPQEE